MDQSTSPKATPPRNTLTILDRLISAYKLWGDHIEHFPKKSKYTLGSKIDKLFLESIELTFSTSYQPKDRKLPYLEKLITRFDLLKFMLRIAWETKALDNKKYISLSEPLNEIGRMIGGWRNKAIKETETPPKQGF